MLVVVCGWSSGSRLWHCFQDDTHVPLFIERPRRVHLLRYLTGSSVLQPVQQPTAIFFALHPCAFSVFAYNFRLLPTCDFPTPNHPGSPTCLAIRSLIYPEVTHISTSVFRRSLLPSIYLLPLRHTAAARF